MHIPVQDEHKFWQLVPCAAEIFKYAKEHPEVGRSSWSFDSGNYSDGLDRVWASFSSGSISGWGKDRLHISAVKQSDGTWQLSHQLARAT
jgi:hypothetical protein